MSLFYSVLFLVIILIFGILLAPFLGGNREGMTDMSSNQVDASSNSTSTKNSTSYDNYNHFTGSSTPKLTSSTFYGQDGSTLAVNMNGTNTLTTTDKNGKSIIYAGVPAFDGSIDTFVGPNGSVAVVVDLNNGYENISVKDTAGNQINYSSVPQPTNPSTVLPNVTPSSTPSTLLPPSTQSTTSTSSSYTYPSQNTSPNSFASNSFASNSFASNSFAPSSYNYSSSLPPGIPASQIPPGHEDLYILKTEVVPPVCPVCPVQTSSKKCPPCPACTRCPEPAYDCKLVPNYSSMNANAPVPVLNDFSTFGM